MGGDATPHFVNPDSFDVHLASASLITDFGSNGTRPLDKFAPLDSLLENDPFRYVHNLWRQLDGAEHRFKCGRQVISGEIALLFPKNEQNEREAIHQILQLVLRARWGCFLSARLNT
jgi:hypothetical protein